MDGGTPMINEARLAQMLRNGTPRKAIAAEIDRHFDEMLSPGMPLGRAQEVEAQRDQAHALLLRASLQTAVNG